MLKTTGLAKTFEGKTLFKNINLEVLPKDKIALFGSKTATSALLRCLAGLERCSGVIEISGRKTHILQETPIFSSLTLWNRIACTPIIALGKKVSSTNRKTKQLLKLFKLQELANQSFSFLSETQKWYAEFIRVVMADVDILIMDEIPVAPNAKIIDLFKSLFINRRLSLIFCTTNPDWSKALANKSYTLTADGEIIQNKSEEDDDDN